jgi:polygalacturonase
MIRRNILFKMLVILVPVVSLCMNAEVADQSQAQLYKDLEFDMPVISEPVFPAYTVSITDFGAVNDGQTLNTKAIADAINAVTGKGGGKVVIPRGLWLTGPIILKNNINLNIEEGALVVFSSDKDLYPLIETCFEGQNTVRCTSPIYGKDLENIAITGKGIFDGTGEVWRPVKKEKVTESQWKNLIKSGGVTSTDGKTWYPSKSYLEGQNISEMNVPAKITKPENFIKIKDFLRPVMVSLVNCKKILIDGPVFQNSPAWCLHPLMCEDLTIRNVTVKNPWYSQNGDGLDIESCKNTIICNSNFDVGDDAICIKSGKDEDGRKRARPTENLVIKNCIVYHGHGGVTIGSEMSGGVKNVSVSACTFIGTDVGLRFKSNRGRGGVVENIYFSNIIMINIPTQAISFSMYYAGLSSAEIFAEGTSIKKTKEEIPGVTLETPRFKNISIKNITCKGALKAAFLEGLPEMNLENITLENVDIEAENGFECRDVNGLSIKGLRLNTHSSPAIQLINSSNIDIEKLEIPKNQNTNIEIKGTASKNITIRSVNTLNENKIIIGKEVNLTTVKVY